jgi:hypothetical protein
MFSSSPATASLFTLQSIPNLIGLYSGIVKQKWAVTAVHKTIDKAAPINLESISFKPLFHSQKV